MLGYICMDALSSNLEDYVFQSARLDPAQQMMGTEALSAVLAWSLALVCGQVGPAASFLAAHPEALLYVAFFAVTSALGTYVSTVTVRLFGPAVFTLLMMSRQIISLVLSVM